MKVDALDFELEWLRLKLWHKRHRKWWNRWRPLSKEEIRQYVEAYPEIPRMAVEVEAAAIRGERE